MQDCKNEHTINNCAYQIVVFSTADPRKVETKANCKYKHSGYDVDGSKRIFTGAPILYGLNKQTGCVNCITFCSFKQRTL
jgi:hypothetical protein